jgi:hypothetical protein
VGCSLQIEFIEQMRASAALFADARKNVVWNADLVHRWLHSSVAN